MTPGSVLGLALFEIWSAVRVQCWVREAVIALDADKEEDHAGFLPLGLILVENGTGSVAR